MSERSSFRQAASRAPLRLLGAIALAFALTACKKDDAAPGQARGGAGSAGARVVPVVAVPVAQKDVPIFLEGLGNAAAYKTVTVRSQVDGRLDKVLFKEGEPVKRGQLLAQIDPRPFQIQLLNAQGALKRDLAQVENGNKNYQRYQQLVEKKLIAQQQADDQLALVNQLTGSVQIDQAAIDSARLNLDYARITAPIDGVTGVRLVDPGNLIRAADPTGIVVLTQLDPIAVLFTLPQDDLPQVAEQMQAGQLLVEAYSRDGSTKLGTGKLELIDNQINSATATMRLKAVFPNPQRVLWPNQFVKARLLLTTKKGALVIPATAILRSPDGTFVYLVQKDQAVQQRPVEVEMTLADVSVISKGLTPGEMVVIDGQNQLRPGTKVQVRTPGQKAQPAARAGNIGANR